MGPSYNNNSGGMPMVGGTFGSASGGNAFGSFGMPGNNQPVVLAGQENNKKHTIRNVIIAFVILVLIIVAVVVAIKIISGKKEEIRKNAEQLYSLLGWASFSGQCQQVSFYANDVFTDSQTYDEYIEKCRNDANTVQQALRILSGASNDAQYMQLYNSLNSAVQDNMIFGEELETVLNIYNVWHQWILNNDDVYAYGTEEAIRDMAALLVECDNNILTNYANQWVEKKIRLLNATAMHELFPDKQEYVDDYNIALSEYEVVMNEKPDIESITKFGNATEKGTQLLVSVISFYDYIKDSI